MWGPNTLLTLILIAVGTGSAQTPEPNELWKAIIDGNADMVKTLLVRGADPNVKNEGGYTPLMTAAAWNPESRCDVLAVLLEAKADFRLKDKAGNTALHFAAG